MRLKKIKLAGFKSFVDPTVFKLPTNKVAIVGPNGCGKSNSIDAVRWVMGESSAKNLRGESMADVIFSGSSARKPVGQASVELVFDNSDTTIKGEYASFAEISIKRQVNREGVSNYYLNNTKCRRKDITDIFLGTGLGPRSYSIIEQGMISRLIEAKPEELRAYLEEAAGISKYKERRRETQNRIKHTHENLNRLNDIREELEKQLKKLDQQAKAAEKFKLLKTEEREQKAKLNAVKWQRLKAQKDVLHETIKSNEIALESVNADLQNVDTNIEKTRVKQTEWNDKLADVQSHFYQAGANVAKLEQQIQHIEQRQKELEREKEQVQTDLAEVESRISHDKSSLQELGEQIERISPDQQTAHETAQATQGALVVAETSMREWQQQWESFQNTSAKTSESAQVVKTNIQNFDKHILQLVERVDTLSQEQEEIGQQSYQVVLTNLEKELQVVSSEETTLSTEKQSLQETIETLKLEGREIADEIQKCQSQNHQDKGRLAALEAQQKIALGKNNDEVVHWLEKHQLVDLPRLAQVITVESGYEQAVESVLSHALESVCIDDIQKIQTEFSALSKGTVSFFEPKKSFGDDYNFAFPSLLEKVSSQYDLTNLLGHIYVVDSVEEALEIRHKIQPYESIVTKEGIWLGKDWLRLSKSENQITGVLAREKELKMLETLLTEQNEQIDKLTIEKQSVAERQEQVETQLSDLQSKLQQCQQKSAQIRSEHSAQQVLQQKQQERLVKITTELESCNNQKNQEQQALQEARTQLEKLVEQMSEDESRRQSMQLQREVLNQELQNKRQQSEQTKDLAHELALKVQMLQSQEQSTEERIEQLLQRIASFNARLEQLTEQLQTNIEPLPQAKEALEAELKSRHVEEEKLSEVRQTINNIDHEIRELETQRHQCEQKISQHRDKLEKERMRFQEIALKSESLMNAIKEIGSTLEAALELLDSEDTEQLLEEHLQKTLQRIQRLGAINLVAIEEFKKQSERKVYLDAQYNDLIEALETLENAIRKIDKETRSRFKETFDTVNSSLQELFPKVFGGGQAYLELTGEDLLDTGVGIIARPPGKRNCSIHLLSGGEKALTAIALVFSIFQLNPSPFCMLDEVDAPLDDNNVIRFCRLIEEMSEKVQFVIITHNKITMELATHLTGVTMHEPGVSRLVTVNVEEATELVEA